MEDGCDLYRLVRFDARATDQQWYPDVKLIQLPLIDGQRELTWTEEFNSSINTT